MKKLVIATTNSGKLAEIMEVLSGIDLEIVSAKDIGLKMHESEEGETYEKIALDKANFYFEQTGELTLAEDSGIEVDALKGELGIKTRRWGAGENASDEEWIKYFFEKMKYVSVAERTARFICVAALKGPGIEMIFRGETNGIITYELMAPIKKGIPLSSCFIPVGHDKVYSALNESEKNLVSHRGKAMHALRGYLEAL